MWHIVALYILYHFIHVLLVLITGISGHNCGLWRLDIDEHNSLFDSTTKYNIYFLEQIEKEA